MKIREITYEFMPALGPDVPAEQAVQVRWETDEGTVGWLEFTADTLDECLDAVGYSMASLTRSARVAV